MQLRSLRYFVVLAELLNFREGAAQLHISQPTLTAAIQSLESELGVQLLSRRSKKTELTHAGSVLLVETETLLHMLERAVTLTRASAEGMAGVLSIGFVSTAVTSGLLSPLIRAFREENPGYELTSQNMPTEIQIERLAAGKLDVGLLRLPLRTIRGLEVVPVHFEPLIAILPRSHRLAEKEHLQVADFAGCEFVITARHLAMGYYDFILKILGDAGIPFTISQEVEEMYTLASLVSSGLGVALAPRSVCCYQLENIVFKSMPELPHTGFAVAIRKDERREHVRHFFDLAIRLAHPDRDAAPCHS